MRRLLALFLTILALAASPLAAQEVVYREVIEEEVITIDAGSERFVHAQPADLPSGIARFGPFRVLDQTHAALVDVTDARALAQFNAMLKAFPGITTLEMIDCPGTEDDRANLQIGRIIRARGMTTHVPPGGSVRSGGVELFLAGARRQADHGAEFAVHSWADDLGLEPKDYAPDGPENRYYIDYYRQMGMSETQARAFYAMTNSVPNASARWLSAEDMAQWVKYDPPELAVSAGVFAFNP